MTREKEIRKEAIEVTHFAQFGHSGRDMAVAYDAFILGAKWADEHPNSKENMVNKQEFIKKAKAWVKNCFIGTFSEGIANNIADEFEKYMEGVKYEMQ